MRQADVCCLTPRVEMLLARAAALLRQGEILAIKGLGGFHLACDATNARAVTMLRERKRRPAKPLAVMLPDLRAIEAHCRIHDAERELLSSPECPIVLLRWRQTSCIVAEVAPNNLYLGVMLPYTPLHHILMRTVERPLVMTSGNLSEEPIAQDNDEALRRLGDLADFFVVHDRAIYARYDDSVWFVPELPAGEKPGDLGPSPQPLRRSRGYSPFPIKLPVSLPNVLAAGAELKNTFCLSRDRYAFLSQHIGDMENLETLEHFEATVELYERLFMTNPEIIAYDLHPDYLATRYARERATRDGLKAMPVQHHHAHIASCLVDNGWNLDAGPVIGVCFDGTGYGMDGHMWGGEFLIADYRNATRTAQLQNLPLAGGDAAVRHPCRLIAGYLYALFGADWRRTIAAGLSLPSLDALSPVELATIERQIDRSLNSPLTSSAGRLFDAVAALDGVRQHVTYEGQAAIELEMQATLELDSGSPVQRELYPFVLTKQDGKGILELQPLFESLLSDLRAGVSSREVGLIFHRSVAAMIAAECVEIRRESGLDTIALSGGCFQNRLLLQLATGMLHDAGFRVLTHHLVPCNDGGLALGQTVIAGLAAVD